MLKVQQFREMTGMEYVKAAVACCFDKTVEKLQWNERLEAFEKLTEKDFWDTDKMYQKASNPVGLRAAKEALVKATHGTPSGYMISLDASSSGLQFLSLLVGCPTSWKLCGGDEEILDAYVEIFMSMDTNIKLERKDVKQCIMTALYGSVAMPKAIFKDKVDEFYDTMENMAGGAWQLNLDIQELWDNVPGNTYDWYLPDGFYACIETNDVEYNQFTFMDEVYEVKQKTNERPKFHKGLGPNLIHSIDGMVVREMYRRCMFDGNVTKRVCDLIIEGGEYGTTGKSADKVKELWGMYEKSGFLSVRILDYLFADTMGLVDPMGIAKLIQTLPNRSFDMVSVHDCFRCHPNNGDEMRRQYNRILCDIKNSNMLEFIASQVVGQKVSYPKVGNIPDDVILNANYAIC